MKKKGEWKPWTAEDRERLRQLAAIHSCDRAIAREMGRRPSAVSWQRRILRIRLSGPQYNRYSGASKVYVPERPEKVERLMRLAERA